HRAKLIRLGVPADVIALVFSLIRQNPATRPNDAERVLAALEADLDFKDATKAPDARLSSGSESGVYSVQAFVYAGPTAQIYRATGVRGRQVAVKLFNHDVPLQRVVDEQTFGAA